MIVEKNEFSISRIKLFKACRRAYQLRYVEGLEPVKVSDPLATGLKYHERIEELYKTGEVDTSDLSKEAAMAYAYRKYIYPKLKLTDVEKWVRLDWGYNKLVGRVDGIAEDGCLVEHKTTSSDINDGYEYDLNWSEQILMYMLMTGKREMWYTVCMKPNIRQKKLESDWDFFSRMVEWYETNTDSKIRLMKVVRSNEDVIRYSNELARVVVDMRITEMTGNYYRNTSHCKCWGRRCEYAPICLDYDDGKEYIEYVKTRREIDGNTKTGRECAE